MDMVPYIENLATQLAASARAASEDLANSADRLSVIAEPAIRLTLLQAVSDATDEISARLREEGVQARLSPTGMDFTVLPRPQAVANTHNQPPQPLATDDGDVARVSLRLPTTIKERAEEQAAHSNQSLNAWIITTIRNALQSSSYSSNSSHSRRGWI